MCILSLEGHAMTREKQFTESVRLEARIRENLERLGL